MACSERCEIRASDLLRTKAESVDSFNYIPSAFNERRNVTFSQFNDYLLRFEVLTSGI
jgi:hypothetical protein